jgi:hypothetical protein
MAPVWPICRPAKLNLGRYRTVVTRTLDRFPGERMRDLVSPAWNEFLIQSVKLIYTMMGSDSLKPHNLLGPRGNEVLARNLLLA